MTRLEWVVFGILLILVLQIRCFSESWLPLRRAFRLLLWLLIPIILLHLFFTPGRLIWPDSSLPFSHEGVNQAAWLALRLCALFVAAMAVSRSLHISEWIYYIGRMPLVGKRLLPFVQLASPMREMVSEHIQLQRQQKHSLRSLPNALATLFVNVWQGAEAEADSVWEHWQPSAQKNANGGHALGVLMGLCGVAIFLASRLA